VVEQEGYSVRKDLPQQPAHQVPQITCPHPLNGVASHKLRKNGVDAVAKTAQQSTPSGSWISLLGGVRGQKFDTPPNQLFFGFGRVVVAVSYDDPGGVFDKFGDDREFVGVGRSHRKTSDDTRPADPHVHPKAVEGLFEEGVFAESSLSFKTPAAVSTSEQAHRQGQRVTDGEGRIMRDEGEKLLPEELLYLPKIGRLSAEGGAMHPQEVWEEMGVVAPEVRKEFCVFVYAEELTDDLYGDDFRVVECCGGSALSETSEVSDVVIYEAEDGYDEGVKIHKKKTSAMSGAIGSTPSVGRSSLSFKSSKIRAHGVS
jgi:hypothetical protein